jgi:PAS domain S-box-containing protein
MPVSAPREQPPGSGDGVRQPAPTASAQREDFFREAFARAAVGIAVTDLAGRFLQVNPAYCAMTGYAEAELLATDYVAITHPDDRAGNLHLSRRLLAGDVSHFDLEKRHVRKDGGVVWTLNSISLRRDGDGRPTHCIALCQDITERKRAEEERDRLLVRERQARAEAEAAVRVLEEAREALRASEEQYRSLADLVPGVVWTARADGAIDYANQFWSNFTGMTLEQARGSGWAGALHPEDAPGVLQVWTRALQTGELVEVEYRLKRAADGVYRWFLARGKAVRDREGRVVKWFGLLTEIEDQKQGAQALERQNALVRLLHGVTVAAYAAATVEEALQVGIDLVCAYTGWPVGHVYVVAGDGSRELVPTPIWHLDRPEDFERFARVTEATRLAAGVGLPGCVLARKGPVWVMDVTRDENFPRAKAATDLGVKGAFGFPVLTVAGVVAVLEFFTGEPREPDALLLRAMEQIGIHLGHVFERKRAEAELREAKAAAEAANRAKSEFLSRMSHELRTPLNAVLGFAQLLEMGALTPRQRQHVEQILKGGRHLLGLINEVLDLARIEAGHVPLLPEPVPVCPLFAEVLDLIRPLAERRGIRFRTPAAGERDVYVLADAQRLKQVLLNLVSNAVKYNHERGSVTLTFEELPPDRVRLLVRDTGPGLPPAKQERLFNPFDRLGAEATGVEGTGLGLVLSKRLTEAMGGTLGVASTAGHGSTFFVELAAVRAGRPRPAECPGAAAPAPAAGGARRRAVLYVEDNLDNLALLEDLLAYRPQVRLLSALQGGLGLDLARQHRPDLVLLDVHLPDMKGDEVLRQLRADPQLRGTPVIVLSADATPHQVERRRAAGASEYLTKPIDVARLLALLDRFLQEERGGP